MEVAQGANDYHTTYFFVSSALALTTRLGSGLIGSTHSLLSSVHGMFPATAHGGGAAFDAIDSDFSEESLNHDSEPAASVDDEDDDEDEEGANNKNGDKQGDDAQRYGPSSNKRSSDGGGGCGGWQDGSGPFIEDVD